MTFCYIIRNVLESILQYMLESWFFALVETAIKRISLYHENFLTWAFSGWALPWNSIVPNASVGLAAVCFDGLQCSSAEVWDEAWLCTLCARFKPWLALTGWLTWSSPQAHLKLQNMWEKQITVVKGTFK